MLFQSLAKTGELANQRTWNPVRSFEAIPNLAIGGQLANHNVLGSILSV